jgi:hypothetical protein
MLKRANTALSFWAAFKFNTFWGNAGANKAAGAVAASSLLSAASQLSWRPGSRPGRQIICQNFTLGPVKMRGAFCARGGAKSIFCLRAAQSAAPFAP